MMVAKTSTYTVGYHHHQHQSRKKNINNNNKISYSIILVYYHLHAFMLSPSMSPLFNVQYIVNTTIYQSSTSIYKCYYSSYFIVKFNFSPSSNIFCCYYFTPSFNFALLFFYNKNHCKKRKNEVFSYVRQRLTCSCPCYC